MDDEIEHEGLTNIRRKAGAVRALFATDEGRKVLDILGDEFDTDELRGGTVEETYFNLGRRDVLVYLKQLFEVDYLD